MTERCVTTSGAGASQAAPDAVLVALAIEVTAATPAEALASCGDVQARVLDALGVAASASGLSVQPSWDHERGRPGKPQAVSRVTARLPDVATAGRTVTSALEAGGKDVRLESLTPVVGDSEAALAEARTRAFDSARTAAEHYAGLAGLRLGPCLQVQEGGIPGGGVRVSKAVATMGGGFDVPQGSQDVSASVTVTWELAD